MKSTIGCILILASLLGCNRDDPTRPHVLIGTWAVEHRVPTKADRIAVDAMMKLSNPEYVPHPGDTILDYDTLRLNVDGAASWVGAHYSRESFEEIGPITVSRRNYKCNKWTAVTDSAATGNTVLCLWKGDLEGRICHDVKLKDSVLETDELDSGDEPDDPGYGYTFKWKKVSK